MSESNQPSAAAALPEDVRKLAASLAELDDLLVSCMRCGMCQAVCPVYGQTLREADVTRGKIALLENLLREMIADADGVAGKLNRCLLCGSCQANCPSGVKVLDIFLRARTVVAAYQGLSMTKKMIFNNLLTRPGLFNVMTDLSSLFQGLAIRSVNETAGTYRAPMLTSFIGERHFPALAKAPFHADTPSLDEKAAPGRPTAAFFPGCVSDKIFPKVARAALKILRKHGVGLYMPAGLACCGIPPLASGDRQAYENLIRLNLKAFGDRPFDYLISPCATCGAVIKEIWPKLPEAFSPDELAKINELSGKTMDLSAFLVKVLKVEFPAAAGLPADGRKRVTYHDSCHLKKSLGVSEEPRTILKALSGLEFVEMPEADRCCGSGGSFTLSHYELSKDIGGRKRDNILSVKPQIVATGCPACMMQMMDMLSQSGAQVEVRHVLELYADSL
jgi:glycolate oxidase iron-sulfur subunit